MENQTTQQQSAQTQQQEKLFTQDDVNRIVGERLARVKNTPDTSGYAEREQLLNQREMRLTAREKLADAGIPKDLLPLVNLSSEEEMKNSIELIGSYLKSSSVAGATQPAQSGYRVSMASAQGSSSGHKGVSDDEIRKAMGLKG